MNAIGVPSRRARTGSGSGTESCASAMLTGASCWTRGGRHQNQRVSTGLVVAVVMALAFAFTNGVHDAANAIATLVATRAARPGPAVLLAAVANILGPLVLGGAV